MAEIFVFGSNLLGIHKKGAALTALEKHGAILGKGIGLQGTSYALPTKANPREKLDLVDINRYVAQFISYAFWTPHNNYMVSKIGCGLAGYHPSDIAPMFALAKNAKNIYLPLDFIKFVYGTEELPERIAVFDDF